MPFEYKEADYEQAIIELFTEKLGYESVNGSDVERDYREPLYLESFESALARLNPDVPADGLADALYRVKNIDAGSLVQRNEKFTDYLQNGVTSKYVVDGEERFGLVKLVDFQHPEKNEFVIANQWTFVENSEKRPDVVIFVNGVPLVVVELKSPTREETDVSAGYRQLKNYMREIPSFFVYNAFCVASDMTTTKAGTITSNEDRFMAWKTVDGSYEKTNLATFDVFFEGMFEKRRFLNILKDFICFNDDGKRASKILAGYHQYFAVQKAVESTKRATSTDGKGGVFWHTQGSGKSLSMVFFAHCLQEALESPTIVVLTDRNDLDDQLFGQFCRCKKFLRQEPVQARSREHLKELLAGRRANGIFFTTIQKFEESEETLSDRRNIVVIADEAHRGQYGLVERFTTKRAEDGTLESKKIVGSARRVRNALPNATYVGFTGTPISQKDRDTQEVFGNYIDAYDMTQAVEDGATRPVYYESRAMRLRLDEKTLQAIDREYENMASYVDSTTLEKSKRELGRLDAILGAEQTIDSLVRDILEHYETHRARLLTGKALIVAYSRPIAMRIYRKILELRPNWTEKIKVVMTSSNDDPEDWREIIGNDAYKEELARQFKDDESPMKIAIVVDMWLTGFDVPSLATMYVYKQMVGHNLMQAIARVNRVFRDKEGGLVVDYVGLASALKAAMKDYTSRDNKNYGDTNVATSAYPIFLEKLEICRDLLHGFDYFGFENGSPLERGQAILNAVDFLLGKSARENKPKEEKTQTLFANEALALRQALSLCGSIVDEPRRVEAAFFEAVRTTLIRQILGGSGKKLSLREVNAQISELLKQSVKSDGIIDLFSDVDASFSLFDERFLDEIARMKQKNVAVELLKRLIADEVKSYSRTNLVKSEKFSELIQKSLNRYVNGLITNEEVIQELLALARAIAAASKEGNELGLTAEELAFYDALSSPQGIRDIYRHETLIQMTKELAETLRASRTIDWQKKVSARAGMRRLVKRLLRKYDYPPKDQEDAIRIVLSQCELWTDETTE